MIFYSGCICAKEIRTKINVFCSIRTSLSHFVFHMILYIIVIHIILSQDLSGYKTVSHSAMQERSFMPGSRL